MAERNRDCWWITRSQAEALDRQIRRQLHYHRRLIKRMDALRFSPTDRLYQTVKDCENTLLSLLGVLHTLTVRHGMGYGMDVTDKWDHDRPP